MGCVQRVQQIHQERVGSSYGSSSISSGRGKQQQQDLSEEDRNNKKRLKKANYYALKQIQLAKIDETSIGQLQNEIDILKGMDHPNIVKAHEVYANNKSNIYIILELCDGGDLYKRLPYSEKQSANIAGKLLSAVKYMHDHGIVHRDCRYIVFFVLFV